MSKQSLKNSLHYLNDIRFPFAEIRILALLKLCHRYAHLLGTGPCRITLILSNVGLGCGGESGIVENHPVQIKKCAIFRGSGSADNRGMQCVKLFTNRCECGVETGYFIADLILRYDVVRHLQRGVGCEMS